MVKILTGLQLSLQFYAFLMDRGYNNLFKTRKKKSTLNRKTCRYVDRWINQNKWYVNKSAFFVTVFVAFYNFLSLSCVSLDEWRYEVFDFFENSIPGYCFEGKWITRKNILNSNYTVIIFIYLSYVWNRIFIIV